MRLSTDEDRDEERALATVAAAAEAGVTVFDTARAYGDNEQLVARALRRCGAEATARIVTKGGMTRTGGAWIPDGRAKAILADCEESLTALDGLPIDLYLIHAPDPRTPWRTSVRALARLADEGLVRRVGLANVNRRQLDEALELAPSRRSKWRSRPSTTEPSGAGWSSAAKSSESRCSRTHRSAGRSVPDASTRGRRSRGSSASHRLSCRSPEPDALRPRARRHGSLRPLRLLLAAAGAAPPRRRGSMRRSCS